MSTTRPTPSRRGVLAALTGLVLLGGLTGPALASTGTTAGPASYDRDSQRVCVITGKDGKGGTEGFCVWFPDLFGAVPR